MSRNWTEGLCNQSSGFLFKHECPLFPQNRCAICDKPICKEHTQSYLGKVVCPDCERTERYKEGNTNTPDSPDSIDPYYHSNTYYHGYGYIGPFHGHQAPARGVAGRVHDPNDFQAGDAESLKNEGDEGFETDMNES